MSSQIRKTSAEWQKVFEFEIIDPDGWDRKNLHDSWEEPITQEEFIHRSIISTLKWKTE